MTQLFESTRNYLRSSTKLGRRLSHLKDDSSGSEASLHHQQSSTSTQPSSAMATGKTTGSISGTTTPRRSFTQNRLSTFFTFDNLSKKNSMSEVSPTAGTNAPTTPTSDTATSCISTSHIAPEQVEVLDTTTKEKSNKESKAERRSVSRQSDHPTMHKELSSNSENDNSSSHHNINNIISSNSSSHQNNDNNNNINTSPGSHDTRSQGKSADLPLLVIQAEQEYSSKTPKKKRGKRGIGSEQQVLRGHSPTLSVSHTLHTVASSYDTRPSDFPSLSQYQAHVWRRNLLEESIMHSLRLGRAERTRSPSQHRSSSRSNKRGKTRGGRQSRDSAMTISDMAKDLPPCPPWPESTTSLATGNAQQPTSKVQVKTRGGLQVNSPYMMAHLNLSTSTTHITHSFLSFTCELPEHQVPHVMSSSVVPNLFRIKHGVIPHSPGGIGQEEARPRGRKHSNARSILGSNATNTSNLSPRVLNGKAVSSTAVDNKDSRMEQDQEGLKENWDPRTLDTVALAV
ncbi:hypothetical protein BGZ94_009358 [Podila epigama]|nr:hypothetical protein BGZ94_009358 [Podila epigama]